MKDLVEEPSLSGKTCPSSTSISSYNLYYAGLLEEPPAPATSVPTPGRLARGVCAQYFMDFREDRLSFVTAASAAPRTRFERVPQSRAFS